MDTVDARKISSGTNGYSNLEQNFPPGFKIEREEDLDKYITLSIGPQHPGSGHMRIVVVVDGDIIVHADPDIGYVHRGEEKMSESRTFVQNVRTD